MPDFFRFLATFQEHLNAEFSRSDVLRALIWPNAGLLLALSAALYTKAPAWLLAAIFILFCGFMLLYAGAYIYFAITDPDALRSERYKLQKIAIEQGLYGDSSTGLLDPKKTTAIVDGSAKRLPPTEREDG